MNIIEKYLHQKGYNKCISQNSNIDVKVMDKYPTIKNFFITKNIVTKIIKPTKKKIVTIS